MNDQVRQISSFAIRKSLETNKLIGQLNFIVVCFCCFSILGLFSWSAAIGQEADSGSSHSNNSVAAAEFFEVHIRPVLVQRCVSCHGTGQQEAGLRLDTAEGLLAGGESGNSITVGNAEDSLLIQAIEYESLEMPPDKPLSDSEISAFRRWINQGAIWPDQEPLRAGKTLSDEDRNWWCLQPVRQPEVPKVDDNGWCQNEIDHFVFRKLAEHQLRPAVAAEPNVLRRRIHFALTGLPPQLDPAETVADSSSFSSAEWIDRLLDSQEYGENQARYWLDLVRYADSDGYRADHLRPHAKHYRDYVIQSFANDKPYDQFVIEQLAGDETDPGNREAIVATMYLRHWVYEHNQRDVEGQWQKILDDITETTADTFLALGLKCAKCHDHKFDPLLQTDYYRLKAFFTPLLPRDDQPVADAQQQVQYDQQMALWAQETKSLRLQLRELQLPELLKHATREGFDKFVTEIKAMVLKPAADRSPYEHQIAMMAERQYDLEPEKLPQWLDAEVEARRQQLLQEIADFEYLKPAPLPTQAFVVSDVGLESPVTTLPDDPANTPVQPGFIQLLDSAPAAITPLPDLQSTGRRTALARWIADKQNPLTARVMVNRIWQQHFGRGLVENASDFGYLTAPPSHPELLDWLAAQFVKDGWSIKKLHRRILNSATYQQTSWRLAEEKISTLDPSNRLLWKMNARRLSAEEISDSILQFSESLEKEKRTIYQPVMRNALETRLSLFDFPDRITGTGKRHRTTTPTQALKLMNNPWVHQQASGIESQLSKVTQEQWLPTLYRKLFAREPSSTELHLGKDFLAAYASQLSAEVTAQQLKSQQDKTKNGKTKKQTSKKSGDVPEVVEEILSPDRIAKRALIHALLNTNEVIYVD